MVLLQFALTDKKEKSDPEFAYFSVPILFQMQKQLCSGCLIPCGSLCICSTVTIQKSCVWYSSSYRTSHLIITIGNHVLSKDMQLGTCKHLCSYFVYPPSIFGENSFWLTWFCFSMQIVFSLTKIETSICSICPDDGIIQGLCCCSSDYFTVTIWEQFYWENSCSHMLRKVVKSLHVMYSQAIKVKTVW